MEYIERKVLSQDKEIRFLKGQISALNFTIRTLYLRAKEQTEITEKILKGLEKNES